MAGDPPVLGLLLAAPLLAALTACGPPVASPTADLAPWDDPVAGAVAVTEWEDQGEPVAPFGQGGPEWGSPEELISAMVQALASTGDVRTVGRVVERRDSGTVIGWVRMELAGMEGAVLAGDFEVEMRDDGGSWVVTKTRLRQHCARPLVDGACD